mmetsp:Transcript_2388/g.3152  ORF Transcript_2388/g.3152 Transcript_2388/m.3152 type:complete len:297 (+) Transcript_2388:1357-2247(+)
MGHQCAFDLGCAHAVTRDVDHVINTAGDPIITILIAAAAVTGEVIAFVVREIGLLETLMVAPDGAHLAGPAVLDAQDALNPVAFDFHTGLRIQNHRRNTKERFHRSPWFGWMGTGQRGHQMTASFSLPPGVDDRAFALADNVVVPVPGLRVDRLAHSSEGAQIAQVVLFHPFRALTHQGADCGGGGVELVHLMLGADLPETASIGIGRHAFKHQGGGTIGQRAINDIAVARDPAHIGRTPVDIAIVVIKRDLMRHRRIGQIAAGGMHNPFGLAGRAGGIKDEQRIFCIHFRRLKAV